MVDNARRALRILRMHAQERETVVWAGRKLADIIPELCRAWRGTRLLTDQTSAQIVNGYVPNA